MNRRSLDNDTNINTLINDIKRGKKFSPDVKNPKITNPIINNNSVNTNNSNTILDPEQLKKIGIDDPAKLKKLGYWQYFDVNGVQHVEKLPDTEPWTPILTPEQDKPPDNLHDWYKIIQDGKVIWQYNSQGVVHKQTPAEFLGLDGIYDEIKDVIKDSLDIVTDETNKILQPLTAPLIIVGAIGLIYLLQKK